MAWLDTEIQFQSLAIRNRPSASPRVISSTQCNDPNWSHVNYYISFLPGSFFFSPWCELSHFPFHSIPAVCWPAAPVTEDELWNNYYCPTASFYVLDFNLSGIRSSLKLSCDLEMTWTVQLKHFIWWVTLWIEILSPLWYTNKIQKWNDLIRNTDF